jgi:hypothetical protein
VVFLEGPGDGKGLEARVLSNLDGVQESLVSVFFNERLAHSTLPEDWRW